MARFPPFKWLVPRVAVALILLACIQLVAFMGVIPSTQQDCECKCSSLGVKSNDVSSDGTTLFNTGKEPVSDTSSNHPANDAEGQTSKPSPNKPGTGNTAINCPKLSSTTKKRQELIQAQLNEYKRLAKDLKLLALDLIETQRDVVTLATVYHRLGKHVLSINSILHSIKQPPIINENTPQRKSPQKDNTKYKNVVCPEKYLGKDLSVGYPWFRTGFATVNCTEFVPISKLVTILLHMHNDLPSPANDLFTILANITTMYPGVKVIVASGTDRSSLEKRIVTEKLNILLTVRVFPKPHQGEIWTILLNDVTTPFVFIATDLTHFNDDIDLVRLIRILSSYDDVVIAGGGYRDQKGHWDVGCLQTRSRNWTMSFRGGYYHSFSDCLACDYLEGPWVAKTEDLKKIGFDRKLEYGAFHDLFWNIKKSIPGGIAVSCPDVMFNIHTNPTPDISYVQLANKWDIKKWIDADGKVRWYGCRRGYEHTIGSTICNMNKGVANPPCDLENFADAIKFVMKECEDAGLFCELQEGTLLGAVKFNKVLPWERDADITFLTANYSAFKKLKPKFAERGYSLSDDDPSLWCCVDGRQAGGKFKVGTSRFTIEMYGQHLMESEMLAARGQSPTKVQFAGQWVNVVRNPGLFARNRYGPNHFRHAEHWMDLGQDTGWAFYNPGSFSPCPYPGHSACLDQYPADGNIQFSDYTSL